MDDTKNGSVMECLKILLCGDSFAADWTKKHPKHQGWPNMLSKKVSLTNLARAGAAEYRILKQMQSIDLYQFDRIIVSHTSPYRIYVKQHPAYKHDEFYQHCDFLYADCAAHNLPIVTGWFENYFDLGHAIDIHHLIMHKINSLHDKILHIGHLDISAPPGFNFVNFNDIWKKFPGDMNHYNEIGNKKVYDRILSYITQT